MENEEIIERVREDTLLTSKEASDALDREIAVDVTPSMRVALAQHRKLLGHKNIAIIDPDADITPYISYNLGLEGGTELFENYPSNFNRIMKAIGDKLKEAGWVKEVKYG